MMARKTKKYLAACEVLSIPSNSNVPHEALYGMLALREYHWSGKAWVNLGQEITREGKIRVECDGEHIEELTHAIADILALAGFNIKEVSRKFHNRKSETARMYIQLEYEVKK